MDSEQNVQTELADTSSALLPNQVCLSLPPIPY